ncbi:MAG: apolipoprotein N-acyltransferase [FCB group bacterium]|nr:apolipoprotein N-acyltransferase [FCB group bacterium]
MNTIFKRPFWQLALLSGGLVGLAYPPLHLGFLAWIGFIPLFHIWLHSSPRSSAKYSYLAAITANIISLYWIGLNSGAGFVPVFASLVGAVLYLGIYWSLFGMAVSWIHRRTGLGLYSIPFLWVTMEWVRSFGSLGFPWINLALTQTDYLPVIQIAELTGTYGIAFWLMIINMGIYLYLNQMGEQKKILVLTGIIFISIWIFGGIRYYSVVGEPATKQFKVSVIQPDIDPNEKWERSRRQENIALMDSLLEVAIRLKPDMVLWPETALPAYLRLSASVRRPLQMKMEQAGIPLLSGTVDRTIGEKGEKYYYNGSIMIYPDGRLKMYYKIRLVPFAEYIPLSGYFPVLKKLNFGQANFTMGEEYTVFEIGSVKFSNVICYESSLPQLVRKFVRAGAQFITIQANDGWLGESSGPYQHFELARLRAVENRLTIVRSANTGISGLIYPSGKVVEKIPLGVQKVFLAKFPIREHSSFYALYGDVFAMLITIISILLLGYAWVKRP